MITLINYDKRPTSKGPIIFLAGPTVRGNQPHLHPSWRAEAVRLIGNMVNRDVTVVLPEFDSPTESDKGKDWIPDWEFDWLTTADVKMFWIPRTRELIGLTTNVEFGMWMVRDPHRMVYGRPDDSFRNRYNDIMWRRSGQTQIYNTLYSTIKASLYKVFPHIMI